MWIASFFTNNGAPATGLSPIIRVRDLADNSLVVTDAGMVEVGDGWYKYNFAAYDKTKSYSIRCDGGMALPAMERYTWAGNEDLDPALILSDATPFQGVRIDAAISSRPSANDIDTQLSGTHGAGSWESGGTPPTPADIADAVLDELVTDHNIPDSLGRVTQDVIVIENIVSFDGSVWIDTTGIGVSGTAFPIGTQRHPVNNFPDAMAIAMANSITKFNILGLVYIAPVVEEEVDISGYRFQGVGGDRSFIDLGWFVVSAMGCVFNDLALDGYTWRSWVVCQRCVVYGLIDVEGFFENCIIWGIDEGGYLILVDCTADLSSTDTSPPWYIPATIGLAADQSLRASGLQGPWELSIQRRGMHMPPPPLPHSRINFKNGTLKIGSGCTNGTVEVEGNCTVTQDPLASVTIYDNTLSGLHGDASWEDTGVGSWTDAEKKDIRGALGVTGGKTAPSGGQLQDVVTNAAATLVLAELLKKYKANRLLVANNQLTIFDDDGVTPILVQNLFDAHGNPTVKAIYERVPV